MKEKIKKVITNREFVDYIIILFVSCILAIPICSNKLNIYYDDGIQHIARALGTLESFTEQKLFPNIITRFTNNFGYSWNLFYGPLSTYGIIIIQIICKSFVSAYKIFAFLCLFFSGILMYKFMICLTKNSNTSLLASIIYLTFPYHLTDWYIRNALGEFMSFMFVPMVFLGLYHLFNTTENHYYLTFGAVRIDFNSQYIYFDNSFIFCTIYYSSFENI